MKSKFKFNLMKMLLLVGLVPLINSVLIIMFISSIKMKDIMYEDTIAKLKATTISAKMYIINNGQLDNARDYIDTLKDQDIDMTVINGAVRTITTLKNEDGSYNVGTEIDSQILKVLKTGQDYFTKDVRIGNEHYLVYYSPIIINGEYVGAIFAGETVEKVENNIKTITMYIVGISILIILIFALIIIWVVNCFKKPIQKVVKELKLIAEGNLDSSIEIESKIIETRELIESTEIIQKNLVDIVAKNKEATGNLIGRVTEVDELTDVMNATAGQIGLAMDELATAAVSMAEDIQNMNSEVVTMGQNINDITENVKDLSNSSKEMEEASGQAENFIKEVLTNSEKSVEAVMNIGEQIDSTNNSIKRINEAVTFIQEITNQTKLLSLNASIEAARAGEAGRGFSVVAENIRQLSEQSSQAVKQIEKIAEEIFGQSGKSISLAKDIKEIINDEQMKISDTQKCFMKLKSEIEKSITEIKLIGKKAIALDDSKRNIIDKVENLGAISEENAASNQEVTASIQSMISDIHNVSGEAVNMKEKAVELEKTISVFKLREKGGTYEKSKRTGSA